MRAGDEDGRPCLDVDAGVRTDRDTKVRMHPVVPILPCLPRNDVNETFLGNMTILVQYMRSTIPRISKRKNVSTRHATRPISRRRLKHEAVAVAI